MATSQKTCHRAPGLLGVLSIGHGTGPDGLRYRPRRHDRGFTRENAVR